MAMDDPIVTLSLWSNQTSSKKPTTSKHSNSIGSNSAESDTSSCSTDGDRKSKDISTQLAKSNGGSKSSGDCFPCLSVLESDHSQKDCDVETQSNELGSKGRGVSTTAQQEGDCNAPGAFVLQSRNSSLLRLFESNMFTIELTLQYLYTQKDHKIREYLGNKLSVFPQEEVDFYLLQLVSMFIHMDDLSLILQKYFLQRCQFDVIFSLKLVWLLQSSITDSWLPQAKLHRTSKMLRVIKNDQIRPPQSRLMPRNDLVSRHTVCGPIFEANVCDGPERCHHRSHSASKISVPSVSSQFLATELNSTVGTKVTIGDLRSGRGYETGCTCLYSTCHVLAETNIPVCSCTAPRLAAQDFFLCTLGNISSKLLKYPTKALKTSHLYAELSQVNLNLPARICLPLHSQPHQIVRIPASEAVVLNSKSKAPYIVLVEVIECEHTYLSPLPSKQLESSVNGIRLSPSEAKHFIHSEGPSPSNTRASSMPTFKCTSASHHSFDSADFSEYVMNRSNDSQIGSDEDSTGGGLASCNKEEIPDNSMEKNQSDEEDLEKVTFSVGDIRKRLSKESIGPVNMFSRDPADPSASAMKEPWESKVSRIRKGSPYGFMPNWKLVAAIIKWGDDLRQEMLCWQLLVQFKNVWREENVPLWIRPYKVIVLCSEGGLIEPICNAVSLHQIKKQSKLSLIDYFIHEFGDQNSERFLTAQKNFVESCAAYCLICYFIQVKDRHNGNILLDSSGRIIHIDFGFILAHSPGNNMRFESSPFKLTEEFVAVMGGVNSDMYQYFKFLMLRGFLAARKHMDRFVNIVQITQTGSKLPCFGDGPQTVKQMQERFCLSFTEEQLEKLVNRMVESSMNSLTTKLYDGFQYLANGIL